MASTAQWQEDGFYPLSLSVTPSRLIACLCKIASSVNWRHCSPITGFYFLHKDAVREMGNRDRTRTRCSLCALCRCDSLRLVRQYPQPVRALVTTSLGGSSFSQRRRRGHSEIITFLRAHSWNGRNPGGQTPDSICLKHSMIILREKASVIFTGIQ